MSAATTLFQLVGDSNGMFDGSVNGIAILHVANAKVLPRDAGIAFDNGTVDVARHRDLDALQSFTIEATIAPTRVGGARQNIVEGQTPAVALFIESNGKLVGSVHTAAGWMTVDSGSVAVRAGTTQRVTFTRDSNGKSELSIDGNTVGSGSAAGPIQNVGPLGFRIGRGIDGATFPFSGTLVELSIRQGVVTHQVFAHQAEAAQRLEAKVRQAGVIKNIVVSLVPDASHARLQHVKDIMNAAGVQTVSDLDTLPVKTRTPLSRGQILLAPKKKSVVHVNWADVAKQFRVGDMTARRNILAAHLTNQNSTAFLRTLPTEQIVTSRRPAVPPAPAGPVRPARPRIPETPLHTSETLKVMNNKIVAVDAGLVRSVASRKPFEWPTTSGATSKVMAVATIPVDSAIVIAGTLDLTEQQLVVEPNVGTLYVIADTVICGNNAAITWRRPGGTTPVRADNPDLDGRTYSGVQPKENSRDGLDGGDGLPGQGGVAGAGGRTAPNVEMWVKTMTGLPNLDFNGEDGIVGGRGQRGGRGGNGADGHLGERWWLFGWHCSSEGGDGGDGGTGGRGGDGGRGGNGGNAGSISIGVLAGTLESTVVNKTFKIKNQGGRRANGGPGGPGGAGGAGGRSGNGETCHGAKDGHNGATGQPGAAGPAGWSDGTDATVTFFEFTQAAWDDLMTRPWISQITPTDAFPGDQLILHGSRFTASDTVLVGGSPLATTVNADESLSVTLPLTLGGGLHQVFVRRADGTESNRVNLGIKPQLDVFSDTMAQGSIPTLKGRAFLAGASVLFNGSAIPSNVTDPTTLTFPVPGTGGGGSTGGTVSIQVRNPDGRVSNLRTAQQPRILEVPFKYGQHNLSFKNFAAANPGWGNYEETFGTAEVWHEQLDPIFGHPILTAAYFGFYVYFLKGKDNGGLATGFCTSLASLVADRFWLGKTDTPTVQQSAVLNQLTSVHGKLLSRQSLLTFHDQGREGIDRVERTYREIEATFLRGTDRQNQPLLFFIPSGEVWDSGYFDRLSDSHCVMPWRFVYPPGRPAPQLTPDGSSTTSDPDGVELFVWDCNRPTGPASKLRFHRDGGKIHFDYIPDSKPTEFKSQDGITLGMMRHGDYMLADHDLPFSGPFGLTSFIIDFLLSPADLQVVDANGLRTGNFGGQLLCEIPGSHPCYLVKGMYLLPAATAMTRTIVGTGAGTYMYNSITPDGTSFVLQDVATQAGHQDVVAISADATQVRFTPAAEKNFSLSVARVVDNQARALSIAGVGGGPGNDVDVTLSPDLNVVRVGNRGATRNLILKAISVVKGGTPVNRNLPTVAVPDANDLAITVTDWNTLDLQAVAVPF
jgi:concanavalin A-like lectin/glucanase superfamily protein